MGCWTLNNALNDIVLTSGYAKDLDKVCMEVWGWRGRQGRSKVRQSRDTLCVDCGLGYKHQRRFYNICVIHILRGVAPRALHGPAKPGQGFQAVGCWTLNDTLNDTMLTSGYAKDL